MTAVVVAVGVNTAVIISLVVSVVIPLFSSLLSRTHWPSEVTGLLTVALATANGFFTQWSQTTDEFQWKSALLLSLGSFLVAVAKRVALWRGTQTDAKLLAVGSKTTVKE